MKKYVPEPPSPEDLRLLLGTDWNCRPVHKSAVKKTMTRLLPIICCPEFPRKTFDQFVWDKKLKHDWFLEFTTCYEKDLTWASTCLCRVQKVDRMTGILVSALSSGLCGFKISTQNQASARRSMIGSFFEFYAPSLLELKSYQHKTLVGHAVFVSLGITRNRIIKVDLRHYDSILWALKTGIAKW